MEEKRVGIITISLRWLLQNYGTFFQHYALRQVLKELGCSPFRVGYDLPWEDFDDNTCNLRAFCAMFWHWLRRGRSLEREFARFLFYRKRIRQAYLDYKHYIADIHEVQISNPELIIVGGDQVLSGMDRKSFGGDFHTAKIAFSASADWISVEKNAMWRKNAVQEFPCFKILGLREEQGIRVVNELCPDVNAVFMPDPVFLLDKTYYESLIVKRKCFTRPTLFVHIVNWYEPSDSYLEKLISIAKELKTEIQIAPSQGCERFVPLSCSHFVGPIEYLRAIRDAEYVVTNSFHGIAFCLLFNKRFAFVRQRNRPGTDQNERQVTILKDFGLEDHILNSEDSELTFVDVLQREIDFNRINLKIGRYQKLGRDFLKSEIPFCVY